MSETFAKKFATAFSLADRDEAGVTEGETAPRK
jgi:hypothetical protein